MRLFDFFRTITTKFKNRDLVRMPDTQYINSANVENSIIHENAYINAYTKQLKSKPSNIIRVEENGRILKMKENGLELELSKIKRLKQALPVEDGRQIDLYSGILEKNAKKNLVYFGLEYELNLKKALEDKNRSYKVSNKMTKMFTIPLNAEKSKFIGSLVEDDIYKNYCITKSNRLENYVNKIEERRIKIIQATKKQDIKTSEVLKKVSVNENNTVKKRGRKSNKMKNEELKNNLNKSNIITEKAKTSSSKIIEKQNNTLSKTNTKKRNKITV